MPLVSRRIGGVCQGSGKTDTVKDSTDGSGHGNSGEVWAAPGHCVHPRCTWNSRGRTARVSPTFGRRQGGMERLGPDSRVALRRVRPARPGAARPRRIGLQESMHRCELRGHGFRACRPAPEWLRRPEPPSRAVAEPTERVARLGACLARAGRRLLYTRNILARVAGSAVRAAGDSERVAAAR